MSDPIKARRSRATEIRMASAIADGQLDVTTAGTPEALAGAATPCRGVLIRAKATNTDVVYVGDATPIFPLAASEAINLDIDDLSKVYVDAVVTGEGVVWLIESN